MIKIEVWSDINCPFCYIGKRHLEAALQAFQKSNNIEVVWKSFELDPNSNPPKGADSTDLLAKKYGRDRQWAMQMNETLTQMAAQAGLHFHLEKVIAANSFNAHRLIHLAETHGLSEQMKEKLLAAKFVEGEDIGDNEALRKAAISIGLNPLEVMEVLESDLFGEKVRADEEEARALGIRGVPFFLFNKQKAISGAQAADVFLAALNEAASFEVNKELE